MNYTIIADTGNIEQDVWTTIDNFSNEQMEQFIEAIRLKKDNSNITGESIFFRYPDCEQFLSSVEDATKVPFETRKLIRKRTYRLDTEKLFIGLSNIEKVTSDLENRIINKIRNKIDIRKRFCNALANDKYNSNFYEMCFKIISSDEYFYKFIQYDENIETFQSEYSQEEYLLELSNILGHQEHDINNSNPVYKYSLITSDMLSRYLKLRKIVNIDIKALGEDVFCQGEKHSYSKERQAQIDNDWEINKDLMKYIMNGMNPQYNVLEQISHIYIRLCQALRYNLGYHIKKWEIEYNKKRQESISLENNDVICSEFSLLCIKLINQLDESVEARCIVTGKDQHISFGIIIREKDIRIDFDATKIIDNFDDLGRVKLGLPLAGINYLCDRNNEFKEAFTKVYNNLCNEYQIETENLIKAYESLPTKKEIQVDFYDNIHEFVRRMQTKNIVGSELLGVFKILTNNGYFGNILYSIVGQDKKLTFGERELLENPEEVLDGLEENIIINSGNEYYLLRLDAGEIVPISIDELNELFSSNKMKYFNPKYQLEGIGVKQCKKN